MAEVLLEVLLEGIRWTELPNRLESNRTTVFSSDARAFRRNNEFIVRSLSGLLLDCVQRSSRSRTLLIVLCVEKHFNSL